MTSEPALVALEPKSSQWELGAGIPRRSSVAELPLLEDERLIAIERPGAFFWGLFVVFCLLVVTLPLALWMLLRSAGKLYAVTNIRSIRVSRGGAVTELLHSELKAIELAGFIGASQVSLVLKPTADSGAKPLTFGLCGPTGAMSRLWGVINFWVLSGVTDVELAPEVDSQGKLVDPSRDLDVAIFDSTRYHKGIDLKQAQRRGVAIFTPTRLIWARSEDIGSGGKLHATIPVHAFVHAVARQSPTVEAFEAEIERAATHQTKAMAEVMSRSWDKLEQPTYSKARGLRYVDTKDGKKAQIYLPMRYEQQAREYLTRHGVLSS